MKKILLIAFILPFISTAQHDIDNLIGTWEGTDKGEIGQIIFDEEGYATFKFGDEVMGGKEFELQGVKASLRYEFLDLGYMIDVDFIIRSGNGEILRTLKGIIKMSSKDFLKLALNVDGSDRPTEFTDDNSIYLTRID